MPFSHYINKIKISISGEESEKAVKNLKNAFMSNMILYFQEIVFGASSDENPEIYDSASPIYYLETASPGSKFPSMLLVHGMKDHVVNIGQIVNFENTARDLRVDVETLYLDDADHGFMEVSWYLDKNGIPGRVIENMMGDLDIAGIMLNENEIDRLYHLITKIVSLSLVDSSILQSSGIGNISLAPSYSRISKRLENIGDNINHISGYMHKNRITFENSKEILNFIRAELNRSINMLIGKQNKVFEKKTAEELKEINGLVSRIKDKVILNYLEDIIRYVIDTEEEIVNITFYSSLMRSNII